MMGGVARAARRGGARTFGVIPRRLVNVEDADDADVVLVDSIRERKRLMDDRADAFLALPGGLGTLEELLEVWTSASLGMHGKPVVVLDVDGFFEPLWTYLADLRRRGFVGQSAVDVVYRTDSVDSAFAELERRIG